MVTRGVVAERVLDVGQNAARIGEGGFGGDVGAGKLRGRKLPGAGVGVGPGARLAVGGIGNAGAGRVGQHAGQQRAVAGGVVVGDGQAGRRDDVRQPGPCRVIGDAGRVADGRAGGEDNRGRQAVAVVREPGLVAVPVGGALREAVRVVGEAFATRRHCAVGGAVDFRDLRHALQGREFVGFDDAERPLDVAVAVRVRNS